MPSPGMMGTLPPSKGKEAVTKLPLRSCLKKPPETIRTTSEASRAMPSMTQTGVSMATTSVAAQLNPATATNRGPYAPMSARDGAGTKKPNRESQTSTAFTTSGLQTSALLTRFATTLNVPGSYPTRSGEKNIGNMSTAELSSILRRLGVTPATTSRAGQSSRPLDGALKAPGILKEASGPSSGTLDASGRTGPGGPISSGQMIRIIDDKRLLIPSKDISSAPLGFDRPSAILSNKIPSQSSANARNFSQENFKIVMSVASNTVCKPDLVPVVQPEKATTTASDTVSTSQSLPSNAPAQSADSQAACTPVSSAANSVSSATMTGTSQVSGSDKSAGDAQASAQLPDSYIQKLHKKYKERKMLKGEKNGKPKVAGPARLVEEAKPCLSSSADVKSTPTTKEQQPTESTDEPQPDLSPIIFPPIPSFDNSLSDADLSATSAHNPKTTEKNVTPHDDNALASRLSSKNLQQKPVVHHENMPSVSKKPLKASEDAASKKMISNDVPSSTPAVSASEPQSKDVFSKINTLLNDVRDIQQGKSSTDALSSRLLELAMQLRGSPSDIVSLANQETQALNTVSVSIDSQAHLPATEAVSTVSINRKSTSAHVSGSRSLEAEKIPAFGNTESPAQTFASRSTESSAPLQTRVQVQSKVVDVSVKHERHSELKNSFPTPDYQRETHTPTLDDSFDSNIHAAVQDSFSHSYQCFKPLSKLSTSKMKWSAKLQAVVQGIESGLLQAAMLRKRAVDDLKLAEDAANINKDVPSTSSGRPTRTEIDQSSDAKTASSKTQKIAHVKPQPFAARKIPMFHVFNPRNNPECVRISLLLTLSGKQFPMKNIADAISQSAPAGSDDGMLVPVTKKMIEKALGEEVLWIVIR